VSSLAQVEERNFEVEVSSKGPEARQEAFQKAIQVISKEMAERRLGGQFLNEHMKRFESDVLSKSEKYILSVKGTGVKTLEEGSKVGVSLTVSLDGFDSVLRQSGLMQLSRHS